MIVPSTVSLPKINSAGAWSLKTASSSGRTQAVQSRAAVGGCNLSRRDLAKPILDARIPYGSRVAAVRPVR